MRLQTRSPSQSRLRSRAHHEQGYLLLVILLMVALLMIALVAAAPRIAQQIRRDREEETIHRGTQYVRAIRLFYRKFGRYPNSLQDLMDTNNMRFLRRLYKDPLSPDGKWRIIHFGEAKVVPTGFRPGASAGQGQPAAPGATAGPGQPTTPDPSQLGTPVSSLPGASSGPTMGGGPIVGVAPLNNRVSIKELNGKNHYNEWEFVYDPRYDLSNQGPLVPGAVSGSAPPGVPQLGPTGPQAPPTGPMGPPMGPK